MRFFISVFFLLALLPGCKKQNTEAGCSNLSVALEAGNTEQVKTSITAFISNLSAAEYTSENLHQLAASISGKCSITATVRCFDCIKTLPSQSEISLSVVSSGSVITRTIDISYTAANKMTMLGMHD